MSRRRFSLVVSVVIGVVCLFMLGAGSGLASDQRPARSGPSAQAIARVLAIADRDAEQLARNPQALRSTPALKAVPFARSLPAKAAGVKGAVMRDIALAVYSPYLPCWDCVADAQGQVITDTFTIGSRIPEKVALSDGTKYDLDATIVMGDTGYTGECTLVGLLYSITNAKRVGIVSEKLTCEAHHDWLAGWNMSFPATLAGDLMAYGFYLAPDNTLIDANFLFFSVQ